MSLNQRYQNELDEKGWSTFRSCPMRMVHVVFHTGGDYTYYECDHGIHVYKFETVEAMVSFLKEQGI